MRSLTQQEIDNAPEWATHYAFDVDDAVRWNDDNYYQWNDDTTKCAFPRYGFRIKVKPIPRKEFDISEYEFSDSSVEIELNDNGELSMWVSNDGLTSESCGLNKSDIIALAKAIKLTAEDFK